MADRVIVVGTRRGMSDVPASDIKQMAGRAGRTQGTDAHVDILVEYSKKDTFIEEIEGAYMELSEEELDFINEKEMTIPCPGCGFECAGISSYCMACGENLHDQPIKEDM